MRGPAARKSNDGEMSHQSSEEVEADYVSQFGDKDGRSLHRVTNRVSQLCVEWRVFLYFFGSRKERVDVLNTASGSTARILQNALWDNALLKIRRLTDPHKTRTNKNLSLDFLRDLALRASGVDLSEEYHDMQSMTKPARDYATKCLAHSDWEHALGDKQTSVHRGETTQAIRAMIGFTATFHERVRNVTYRLMPITALPDEQDFLLRLHLGNQADEAGEALALERALKGVSHGLERPDVPSWVFDMKFRNEPF